MSIGKNAGGLFGGKGKQKRTVNYHGLKLLSMQRYEEVSVFSIARGCGCSHVALTVANYMAEHHPKERIAIISDDNDRLIEAYSLKNVVHLRSADREILNYRYKVYDIGMIQESEFMSRPLNGRRLMILPYHHDRMYILELFTRVSPIAKDVVYLFNRVPKRREREISGTMELYSHNFLPVYDLEYTRDVDPLFELYL